MAMLVVFSNVRVTHWGSGQPSLESESNASEVVVRRPRLSYDLLQPSQKSSYIRTVIPFTSAMVVSNSCFSTLTNSSDSP